MRRPSYSSAYAVGNPSAPYGGTSPFRGGYFVTAFSIMPPLKGEVPSRRFTAVSEAEGFVYHQP